MNILKVNRVASVFVIALAALLACAQPRKNIGRVARTWPPGTSDYVKSEFIGIEMSPTRCKVIRDESKLRDCGGVAGYRLLYGSSEQRPNIAIITPGGKRFPITYWKTNDDNFIGLSTQVEWRFLRSRNKITPLALILIATIKPAEFSRFGDGPYTIMVKITPDEVCTVGRIPPGPGSSSDIVGFIIDSRYRKCVGPDDIGRVDWLGVVFGLVGERKFEDAKSTIRNIRSPGGRAVAYSNIATAQAEAGDVVGARTTLFLGLADAQRKQTTYLDEYGNTVNEGDVYRINILGLIGAMTRVGLYGDARATMKYLEPDDVFLALVTVAKIQGWPATDGRGDREASLLTFKEAFELALTPANSGKRDYWLFEIVNAQLDIGFIEDAKLTARYIQTSSTREAAEYSIRMRSKPN